MTQLITRPVTVFIARIPAPDGDARRMKFKAAVAYKPAASGYLVGAPKGRRPIEGEPEYQAALRDLEHKLQTLGAPVPQSWDVKFLDPAPAAKPEPTTDPAEEPEPLTLRMAPVSDRDASLDDACEAAIEAAKVEVLPPVIAGGMPAAVLTPAGGETACKFWIDVYRQAVAKLVDLEWPGENPAEKLRNFRTGVDAIMRTHGCVGAWDRDIAGNNWVRHAQSFDRTVVDPTVKVPTHGKPGREWDLSPKKAPRLAHTNAPKADKTKKAAKKTGKESASYQGSREAWRVAAAYGNLLGNDAETRGEKRGLAFKIGVVVSLRAQEALGFPRYEADLEAAGVPAEYLASAVAAYRSAPAK